MERKNRLTQYITSAALTKSLKMDYKKPYVLNQSVNLIYHGKTIKSAWLCFPVFYKWLKSI